MAITRLTTIAATRTTAKYETSRSFDTFISFGKPL